jgi:uncharacterized RDD family membrane protein YckC
VTGAEWLPPSPPQTSYVYAAWWRRAVALLIDGCVLTVIALLLLLPFATLGFELSANPDEDFSTLILSLLAGLLVVLITSLLYAPLLMARTNGQTLGKIVTRCRVVRTDGQPIDFGFAALREVVVKNLGVGLAASATFGLGYLVDGLWPLWDAEKRALHDIIVNTRVVRS